MPDPGKSSADLRREAAVGTLVRNGVSVEQNPLDLAQRDLQRIAAAKLIQRETLNLEADTLKLENDKLRAHIERRQLEEATTPRPGEDTWRTFLMEQLQRAQEQAEQAREEARAAEQTRLAERIELLQAELVRLRPETAAPTAGPGGGLADQIAMVRATVEGARELVKLQEGDSRGVGPSEITIELEKHRINAQALAEQRRWEFEAERRRLEIDLEIRRFDLELKRHEFENDEARKNARMEREGRFMNETLPQLSAVAERWFTTWMASRTPASPLPTAAPSTRPPALPEGVRTVDCPACGIALYYAVGQTQVVCPGCFAILSENGEDAGASRAAAPVES